MIIFVVKHNSQCVAIRIAFTHIAEYQSSLSIEPDWIQKPVKDYLVVHGLQETTITRYVFYHMYFKNKYVV